MQLLPFGLHSPPPPEGPLIDHRNARFDLLQQLHKNMRLARVCRNSTFKLVMVYNGVSGLTMTTGSFYIVSVCDAIKWGKVDRSLSQNEAGEYH